MMRFDIESWIQLQHAFFGNQCLRHALMLLFEQELPVEIRQLDRTSITSMVSISRICTLPIGDFDNTFRISHPIPPTPTIKILVLDKTQLAPWIRLLILKLCLLDASTCIFQLLVILSKNYDVFIDIHIQLNLALSKHQRSKIGYFRVDLDKVFQGGRKLYDSKMTMNQSIQSALQRKVFLEYAEEGSKVLNLFKFKTQKILSLHPFYQIKLADFSLKYFIAHYAMIINQYITLPMDQCQTSCCLCNVSFSECSQPRMMPNCEHNACSNCLKHSIMIEKKESINCCHCGHQQNLKDADIQSFPKNISLMKMLKEATYSIKISNVTHQSSQDTSTSASIYSNEADFCQQHKKKTEIICINDRVKLCAHCALFGSHQNHQFKTVNEVNQLMQSRYQQFLHYKSMKNNLDARINSTQFKENIVKKIGQEKDRLISDIKKKFAKITENIKLAEKKAYEDVIKNFKTVYAKILSIMKEENQSQKKYKTWESKCTQLFQKAAKMRKIEDKIILYIDGPLEICTEGSSLLHRLQSKINNSISSIETLISQIKIHENHSISNSVFNYINVVLQDNETLDVLGFMPQDALSPRKIKDAGMSQHKIQFGPDHLAAERMSLSPVLRKKISKSSDNLTKLCSQKRPSSKVGASTPERGSVNTLIEQFCERDLDTLDLTSYSLNDSEIYEILAYLRPIKKIKGLKLVKNKLTNDGLVKIMELIPGVTNLNLSFNQLCDDSMVTLLTHRSKIPYLRIINLSNNKINERRTKNSIDQLKKQGLIVTI